MENKLKELTKSQIERLIFIEFRAYFLGEVKRSDIMERFGVGSAAATRDISLYKELAADNITLEQKSKSYLPTNCFKALFNHPVDQALSAISQGYSYSSDDNSKSLILAETPSVLSRPKIEVLAPVTRAIHRKRVIRITYNSFSSGKTNREIVPFSIVNNGHRWHTRAFDRKSQEFRDFVFTRIESPQVLEEAKVEDHEGPSSDAYWSRIVELELTPHPDRPSDHEIIMMDYEMTDKLLKVKVRAALAGYLLRQWSVDCSENHSQTGEEYRLWLKNYPILYGIDNAKLAPGYAHAGLS